MTSLPFFLGLDVGEDARGSKAIIATHCLNCYAGLHF